MIAKDEVVRKLAEYSDASPDNVYAASLNKSAKNSANQQI